MGSSRSNARIARFAIFALVLIVCGYVLSKGSTYQGSTSGVTDNKEIKIQPEQLDAKVESKAESKVDSKAESKAGSKSNLMPAEARPKALTPGKKVKATFVTLARNGDLSSLLESIRQVEDRFNHRYHYDWVFLNNDEFNDEFKEATSAVVSGSTKYGLIPTEHWSYPEWISKEKAALTRERMSNIIYGSSESYRHMCRYESGFFFRHELLQEYDYYWRVEPDIKIFCDIDYDVFEWMQDNGKEYSFTISLPEYKETIETLWPTVRSFMKENPQYIAENNLMDWISNDKGETYNGCHFWSNFEIASLKVWRSEAYQKYFDYLDKAGGFFYERWGDAPVHSIAVALFLDKSKVHFFDDLGYFHIPFNNCPISKETRLKKKCVCKPNDDFTWRSYSCVPKFYTVTDRKRPQGWENFAN